MIRNQTKCIKVSDTTICPYCQEQKIIKNGKTKNQKQQYYCKNCQKRFIENYTYNGYCSNLNHNIILLTKEGLGIRSTARVLQISTNTLLKRLLKTAKQIENPIISLGKKYQVDEMRTYIKHKGNLIWLVYALENQTKNVVCFNIGKRTNKTLNFVLQSLKLAKAKTIFTDGLKNYRYLISKSMHCVKQFGTNHIERHNLNLRTHLKRLNRKTICYSRSLAILSAIVKIYFWG